MEPVKFHARVEGFKPSSLMLTNGILGFYVHDDKLFYTDKYHGKTTDKWIGLEGEERVVMHEYCANVSRGVEGSKNRLRSGAVTLIKYVRNFAPHRINTA